MSYLNYCGEDTPNTNLKADLIAAWMEKEWISNHPESEWVIVDVSSLVTEEPILAQFKSNTVLAEGYRFRGRKLAASSAIPYFFQQDYLGQLDGSTGSYIYEFEAGTLRREVAVVSAYYTDGLYQVSFACIARDFLAVWASFLKACNLFAYPEDEIMVIGGNTRSLHTRFRLEDVILSEELKSNVLSDVQSFFERGVGTYRSMKLNPFRKILLTGMPGTGKTMLCNALATWALERAYRVIYVSSLQRAAGEQDGANFWKVQQALWTASAAQRPAMIILEEMDAYLKQADKALILNVLDGAEGHENPFGTMLVATTNYPEAIDERILKRPGRLDRIYVVPPIETEAQALAMLRHYLKDLWSESHQEFAPQLVGYPGSFVREMTVFAITQMIQENQFMLTKTRLQEAFISLKEQLEERNQFIAARENGHSEN